MENQTIVNIIGIIGFILIIMAGITAHFGGREKTRKINEFSQNIESDINNNDEHKNKNTDTQPL